MLVAGCGDTVKQKEKTTSETTVKENKMTGEQTTETKEDFNARDSATGAEVKTSKEEETTVKPAQRDGAPNGVDKPAAGDVSEPASEKPVEGDQK
jgi:hypothetical protein